MTRRLTAAMVLLAAAAAAEPLDVTAVRYWSHTGTARIAIEITGEARCRAHRAGNPDRIFFDFAGVRPDIGGRRLYSTEVGDKLVKRIRVAETAPGITRVVLDLESAVDFNVSRPDRPGRLIIELRPAGAAPATERAVPAEQHAAEPVRRGLVATGEPAERLLDIRPPAADLPALKPDVSETKLSQFDSAPPAVTAPAMAPEPAEPSPSITSGSSVEGTVIDQSGAVIPGVSIQLSNKAGFAKETLTDEVGRFVLRGLAPGRYRIHAALSGFADFENNKVDLGTGQIRTLNIPLALSVEEQRVTVESAPPEGLSTEPTANAGALILREADLDVLPDDPDDLEEDLKALAGPTAGPDGPQMFIDGFSGGHLPPKESIREIRINQNPFSAEYDKVGFGRIEVFTKPGTDKFRGLVFFRISDATLDSRNPYSNVKPPFQSRLYGGNLSGPLSKRASFFLDFERREIDQNTLINATIVDQAFRISPLNEAVVAPHRRTTFSPRLDYQLSARHTLTARYNFLQSHADNAGVGRFSLLSHGYNTADTQHTVQITETAVISPQVVNETRFQFIRSGTELVGDSSQPTISVLDSFVGGGAQVGRSFDDRDKYELQNYTSIVHGTHTIRFGGRFRADSIGDTSPRNFAGTFLFSGGLAPELDSGNQVVLDSSGQPVLIPITSIERYRRTLLFVNEGLSPAEIRALGGGASQFTVAAGLPATSFSQRDAGVFLQDDWRVTPTLSLSGGLRYEFQNHIHDWTDFGPRIGFAWAPGARGGRRAKTVIRGGSGVFYDRFGENLVLQALRYNGITQKQFVVHNPKFFPNVPSIHSLEAHDDPQIIRQIGPSLRAPYIIQSAIGIERQLPFKLVVATTFTNSHAVHLLRSRNINAPVASGERPFGGVENIYSYESVGILNQNQLITNVTRRFGRRLSMFGYYVYSQAHSNTDGAGSFPADQYDLRREYSRAIIDTRHRFVLGGTILSPGRLALSPFVIARSGAPFNITTGHDNNGDTLYTDRPAFGTDLLKTGVVSTGFGAFDPNPAPGALMIPRNYGQGPAFFNLNLRVSRTFGFGTVKSPNKSRRSGLKHGGVPKDMSALDSGSFNGMFHDASTEHPYNVTFSIVVRNLLNNFNAGMPIGNITSPWFGRANALASASSPEASTSGDNRRIQFQIRFGF